MICDLSGVCDILGLGDCSRAIRPSAWTFHCWPGSVSEHSLREMLAMSFQLAVYMVSIAVLSSVYDLGQIFWFFGGLGVRGQVVFGRRSLERGEV